MRLRLGIAMLGCLSLVACGPDMNAVANRLREQNITQEKQIGTLQEQVKERDARVAQLQGEVDGKTPRVQTLPDDRLAELFLPAKVEIRPQTDSWDFGGDGGPDTGKLLGFRVFVRTLTAEGQIIPATGKLEIEAFALPKAPEAPERVGTWTFTALYMKKNWYDSLGLHQFAFNCPWEKPPTSAAISFRVTFTDALTGRVLTAQLDKNVTLPKAGAAVSVGN
jgi:hypothetical protein